jgi:hypothetical protein
MESSIISSSSTICYKFQKKISQWLIEYIYYPYNLIPPFQSQPLVYDLVRTSLNVLFKLTQSSSWYENESLILIESGWNLSNPNQT